MIGVGVPGADRKSTRSRAGGRASERDSWIALSQLPGIGPVGFFRLVAQFGSAGAALAAGPSRVAEVARLGPHAAHGLAAMWRSDARSVARAIESATARVGGRVVTALDDGYPPALLTIDPRPPTLFIVGDDAALRRRAIAIVGTRRASGYGLSVATELAAELARVGVIVVSGLALGIDAAAHRAATDAGGPSIAVLPSPLDRIYPPGHRGLARDILRVGGALVSEIAIGAPVGKPDFARRNRIIAVLSSAVVVVGLPDRPCALLTAAAAHEIGARELYAVPGPIDAMSSRGCNRLIADKQAELVTSVAALLREVGVAAGERPPAVERLSEVEGQVLERLLERSGSIEELVDRTSQTAASVASALTLLEVRGLVNAFGGATFHPTLAAKRLARLA
jgi:DNA processing protein